jgi:histidinol-phosphate aminotransferase
LNQQITNLPNPSIPTLKPKQVIDRADNAIRLDKGELPYPPSPHVINAIANAARQINRYPEVLSGSLKAVLSEYTGRSPEQIIIGNGSDDLIELIIKVFVAAGDEVILPIPTFFVYGFSTQLLGGIPVTVPRNEDFSLDLDAIFNSVTPKTKVLFIANPNNPTANLVSRESLITLCDRLNCIIVIDECYYEFCQETVADLLEKYPNLIVLRSFSKSFGLAGVRVGYGLANSTIIDYLNRAAQLFPINRLALTAAIAALEDRAYFESNIALINQDKLKLAQQLEQLGFIVYPSATNFLFINSKLLAITSQKLVQSLQELQIFVADFGLQAGLEAYYFRTAVGTPQENEILLGGLRKIIEDSQKNNQ